MLGFARMRPNDIGAPLPVSLGRVMGRVGFKEYEMKDHLGDIRAVVGDPQLRQNTTTMTAFNVDLHG
jgi:hypothetical protein